MYIYLSSSENCLAVFFPMFHICVLGKNIAISFFSLFLPVYQNYRKRETPVNNYRSFTSFLKTAAGCFCYPNSQNSSRSPKKRIWIAS